MQIILFFLYGDGASILGARLLYSFVYGSHALFSAYVYLADKFASFIIHLPEESKQNLHFKGSLEHYNENQFCLSTFHTKNLSTDYCEIISGKKIIHNAYRQFTHKI